MDLVDRIKHLLKENKITQKKLADFISLDTSTLSQLLNRKPGRKFSPEQIAKTAELFQTSLDYLYGLETDTSRIKFIPLIGYAHCGEPQDYDLNGYDLIPIGENEYKQKMYAVKTEGDSMLPKIGSGDILYCIFDEIITSGDIIHYSLNGESGIRKYKINDTQTIISLVPLNSDYDIITIHHDEYFDLKMAKVVGLHRVF